MAAGHNRAVWLDESGGRGARRVFTDPQFDYIRAAQALGVSDRDIILRHMLPNAMVATLTFLPFILCSSITTLTSLDFLGFGLPLGSPSLGELLFTGEKQLTGSTAGDRRLSVCRHSAIAADFYRRSGTRRL